MIFVDTWAWVALASEDDQYHAEATKEHRRLIKVRKRYVTTNFVLSETITLLYRKQDPNEARIFLESVFEAFAKRAYELVEVSSDQFQRAWQMRKRYADKPKISFVDFTSMIVMQDRGIAEIFSGDAHFEHVGLNFKLVP